MTGTPERHISPQTLEEYVANGVAATIPIPGTPETLFTIDPPNETLRLEIVWDGEAAPVIGDYVHIAAGVHFRNARNWSTLEVHGSHYFAEAFPLLRSVADLVQEDGLVFAEAVRRSLSSYHDLLASSAPMSLNDEVGLFGELLVVSHLIDSIGANTALLAWRGGDEAEEHDLGLEDGDVEIKTTTSENRRHWISSLTQLVPSKGRPLWLLSIQITGAGAGKALRLPDLVEQISGKLEGAQRTIFEARLEGSRYRRQQPRDRFRLFALRSTPSLFHVDEQFPRIDPTVLEQGGAQLDNIAEVSYTVLLDGVSPATQWPAPLTGLGQE